MSDINKIIHDIRNPLNGIAMNAELAKLLLESSGDQEKILKALDTILSECRKCGELLDKHRQADD